MQTLFFKYNAQEFVMNPILTSYRSKDSLEFDLPQIVLFSKIPNTSSNNLAIASNNHVIGQESQLTTIQGQQN